MDFTTNLKAHIASGYTLLYIQTYEEIRIKMILKAIAVELEKKIFLWTAGTGLAKVDGDRVKLIEGVESPEAIIEHLYSVADKMNIFVLYDFHPYLKDPIIQRKVRDIAQIYKEEANNIIMVSPVTNIPEELQKDVTFLEMKLPDEKELEKIMETTAKNEEIKVKEKEQVIEALKGLTTIETENVLSLSICMYSDFNVEEIRKTKAQIVKKSGILEYFDTVTTMEDVGGFNNLKKWLSLRKRAFSKEAKEFGLKAPKGILMLGIPGCGKSLVAKSIAHEWGYPLLKCDIGKIFGSLVGQSEGNMREALNLAEAVSPCILMIDEVEKGLAGSSSGGKHDSGVTSRVFGTFLSWMQERKSNVFVVATANQINLLPPEFLRKGRFDELFFVDLPNKTEREEIFSIHIKNRKRNVKDFDLDNLAEVSDGYTGSEIEEAINTGMYIAFSKNREVSESDIIKAIKSTFPLSKTMSENLKQIRDWARERAVNVTEAIDAPEETKTGVRKIKKLGGMN